MKIALAQINTTVGDLQGNAAKIVAAIGEAEGAGADIVLLPELSVPGYPPKDFLLKRSFVQANIEAMERIAAKVGGITAVVGYVEPHQAEKGRGVYNTAAICRDGCIVGRHRKILLPTYDVFDETRYFDSGETPLVIRIPTGDGEVAVGVTICEDLWSDDFYFARRLYQRDPSAELRAAGAECIVNIGASPFAIGKPARRVKLFSQKAADHGVPLAAVNLVGGNDDLIFDGASTAFDATGNLIACAKSFAEDMLIVDFSMSDNMLTPMPENAAAVLDALVLGTRDYIGKCGFKGVVIGVSGGIDSAVTAAVAAEAFGADRVHLVAMPSRFSSEHSLTDAELLANTLGCEMRTIPIEAMHAAAEQTLAPHFNGQSPDVTEENMQARARGSILMALSNKFGWLLLTTGNKSELAVGYCTLYGDMCGGLAVISDVPKTMVYKIARLINERAGRELVPEGTITKPPSAELRPDQLDQDSLPAYDTLDAILERYIENEETVDEIVAAGFDEPVVRDVVRKVDRNEHKRKQAAVGLKVTSRAFGTGRRMPIAAKYS